MAEAVLSALAEAVLQQLVTPTFEVIGISWCIKDHLEKLKSTFSAITAVLRDAEEQQRTNNEVRDWLGKLKDAVYNVDDVLDEFALTEELRRRVENHGSMTEKVCTFCSSSNSIIFFLKMAWKIKEVTERLDEIAEERHRFHLQSLVQPRNEHDDERSSRRATHSFVNALDVVGRDNDKEKIIDLLRSSGGSNNVSVIPIVGIGGLGKTALTKLVYNDERVIGHFDIRMWVWVWKDFDVQKMVKKIIESATSRDPGNISLDKLQACLRDNLNGKKFLLILDDVWNEDRVMWRQLEELLRCGANGSKIIVTTRSEEVASAMRIGYPPIILEGLSADASLSLFMKWAFVDGTGRNYPNLVEIGREIIQKCQGVPLALQTLGSLLYQKTEGGDWKSVRDSAIWRLDHTESGILSALLLSYVQMPSHLKQCFEYCSLFQKDHVIHKETLVQLWMAQGFIHPAGNNWLLEDIGSSYFDKLLSRCFFQQVYEGSGCETARYKMHYLMHDLACLVAGKQCFLANMGEITDNILVGVRHMSLSMFQFSEEGIRGSILKGHKVRTFFSFGGELTGKFCLDSLILRFGYLRVIDLSSSMILKLPRSVGKLRHLRYLNLNDQKLEKLPNSICKLQNLQTLKLSGCSLLRDLPRDIGRIVSLRHLEVTSQLRSFPEKGMGALTSLQSFSIVACDRLAFLPEEMRHLAALRTLHIVGCPLLAILPIAQNLTKLECLEIRDCLKMDLSMEDRIRGLKSLRSFCIVNLPKLVNLPGGLQDSANTLQYLCIAQIQRLTTLPEWLEGMGSLRRLDICHCRNLQCLPDGMRRLTVLHVLRVEFCHHLRRRCRRMRGEDWPKIQHIREIYLDKIKIQSLQN